MNVSLDKSEHNECIIFVFLFSPVLSAIIPFPCRREGECAITYGGAVCL